MKPYSVAGVDYGTKRIAIAIITSDGGYDQHILDISTQTKTDDTVGEISILTAYLETTLQRYKPDLVAIEQPIQGASRNVRVGLLMGMVAGALSVISNYSGADVTIVAPATWKKSVIGRGNADKTDVSRWLELNHPGWFQSCVKNQDIIDATCIALHAQKVLEGRSKL